MFQIPGVEGRVGLNDRSRTLLVPVIRWQLVVLVVLAMEVPGASGAPWGVIGTGMSGASNLRSAAPSGVASTPGSLGAMRPELPRLYLLSSPNSASPPINWRRVKSEAELACSQVTTTEWLLHQTLASVYCNILHSV
jgi:hypothetical protein